MKKRVLLVLLLGLALSLLCAYDWPPESYEMPRTVLTPDTVKDSLGGLTLSIKAIANTGLNILGVLVPVLLIFPLFDKLVLKESWIQVGVKTDEFRRTIKNFDQNKNPDIFVDYRVAEMEISGLDRQKFRQLHPEADLEERIYQRELSYSTELAFREIHPELEPKRRRRR